MRYTTLWSRMLLYHALALNAGGEIFAQEVEDKTMSPSPLEKVAKASSPLPQFNAAIPEGKMLPSRTARFRLVHRSYDADKGFGQHKQEEGMGLQSRTAFTA